MFNSQFPSFGGVMNGVFINSHRKITGHKNVKPPTKVGFYCFDEKKPSLVGLYILLNLLSLYSQCDVINEL